MSIPLHTNRIAWKLIKALILFSSLITLLATVLQLWFEYDRDIGMIETRFVQVERGYLTNVAENTWQNDASRLSTLLAGIMEFPDFKFAGVRDENGELLTSVGRPETENVIRQVYPLSYEYRGNQILIGELEVIASLLGVYDRTIQRFGLILASNGIKTFFVSGFMFMVVFWLLTRHLNVIVNYSHRLDVASIDKPLTLNRGRFSGESDEIDLLADTLNEMRRKLSESYRRLDESEQQKRLILKTVPDLIWLKDINGVYLACNPMFERFFGAEERQIIGKTDYDFVDKAIADSFRENDIAAIEAEKPRINEEWVTFSDDGHRALLETIKTPFQHTNGEVVGVLGIGRDITRRMEHQDELRLAKAEAELANQAKSEFLASMSHELRTPLNAILGFGQLMQIDPNNTLTQTQNEHIESILAGGKHLLELVNQILDLARIEAKQDSMTIEAVIANEVVANCISLTRPLGEVRDITFVDHFSEMPVSTLRTDRMRFKQVLLNLISNAVKYNAEGGTVTISGEETEKGFLRITVTDTGAGIDQKHYSSVFQMFHRLGQNSAITHEGTGIGLAVTKLLVEHMGGQIGFESKVGEGSTFWFELPLASNEDPLIWADAMRIGVDALDKDHQKIVDMLNNVVHRTIDDPDLDDILHELLNYTRKHFSREEAVMEACHFPDIDRHRALHHDISKQVTALDKLWEEERSPEIIHQIREFLGSLWLDHVVREDVKIAEYTTGKGRDIREALDKLHDNNIS